LLKVFTIPRVKRRYLRCGLLWLALFAAPFAASSASFMPADRCQADLIDIATFLLRNHAGAVGARARHGT
jgi:hypothetical protein